MRLARLLTMFVAASAALLPALDANGQLFPRLRISPPVTQFAPDCVFPNCVVAQPGVSQVALESNLTDEIQSAIAESPNVRCRISGACGSGFIAGWDGVNCYVVTNAHVVGTTTGRLVTIDFLSGGQMRSVQGRVVLSMYHSQRLIDAAIVRVEGLQARDYMPMLKELPTNQPFATRGSPRCVWPQVTKAFDRVIISPNSPLIRGLPDAIPGQSGSGIHNSDNLAIGLVTWSWGGMCAGQQTHWIWRLATERNLSIVPARPIGLQEVFEGTERPLTEDGIFIEGEEPIYATDGERQSAMPGELAMRPRTDDGIFNLVDSRLADLPIWYIPGGQDPKPEPEPDPCPDCPPCDDDDEPTPDPGEPDCYELTQKEIELIEFLRTQNETQRGGFLQNIDWVELARIIMQIISMFR